MSRWLIPATLSVFFFIALVVSTSTLMVSADLQGRGPILIDGDDNFTPANGVRGGSGTPDDPYIIENWVIDASSAHGIHIKNTRSYFIIRNVLVRDGYLTYSGIYFENVRNGRIENVTSRNNLYGIFLGFSNNNTISNSTVSGNYYGIYLYHSGPNYILNNILGSNNFGLYLYGSSNNTISGNIVENNYEAGLVFNPGHLNTVSNNIIGNGIQLFNSNTNTISSNTVRGGISLESSTCNEISNNTIINGSYGIHIKTSSHLNTVSNNRVNNTDYGIRIVWSNSNLIFKNILESNTSYGIYLGSAYQNILFCNYLRNTNNALDEGFNYWDNGGVGNWWSDWQPPDHPDSNRDGIVDERRQVTGNNYDNYPLVIPVLGSLHIPIYINGDDNFTPLKGLFLGSGTPDDPYIIENWAIDASSDNGIHIKNTTKHFIIRNCLIENGSSTYGIFLENAQNGRIENVKVLNSCWGIYIQSSEQIEVNGAICQNNSNDGIGIYGCRYVTVSNATSVNNNEGIHLEGSENCVISDSLCELNTDAGVYIYGSENVTVSGSICENNSAGGIVVYSDRVTLSSNICENNDDHGIYLSSSGSLLENNRCSGNGQSGINLYSSQSNILSRNKTTGNKFSGIELENSSLNTLYRNVSFGNGSFGIALSNSSLNSLEANTYDNSFKVPGISAVSFQEVTSNSATVVWTTLENSTSTVEYGTTPSFGSVKSVGGMTTSHLVTLTGLAGGMTYYFRAKSRNDSLNEEISETLSFTTLPPSPPPSPARVVTRLGVEPSEFTMSSGGSATLTATLMDADGRPVRNRNVVWTATAGSLSPTSGLTDNLGRVTVVYTAPSVGRPENVVVRASFAGDSFYEGCENSLTLTVLPMTGPEQIGRIGEFVENAGVRLGAGDLSALENSVLGDMVGTCISILENGELLTAFRREDLSVSVRRMRPGEIVELDVDGRTACVVILNLASGLLPENFRVFVDGQPAYQASSYTDVLNPLDEHPPEYLILQGSGWIHVGVSISGFSVRTITLCAPEKPTGVPWVLIGALIVVVVVVIIFLLSGRRIRRRSLGPL